MSIRLNFIVEGQTEEAFVKRMLKPHLASWSIGVFVHCVTTKRKGGHKYRGGVLKHWQVRRDIEIWMKEDQNQDARFTTMFDLYGLPADFPGYQEAKQANDPYKRVRVLEDAMGQDISDSRFIPYFQLHEFEALLLSDPQKLYLQFDDSIGGVRKFVEMVSEFESPEVINDGATTAPSKRIIEAIPEYKGMKVSAGPIVAEKIGLTAIRRKCKHFEEWLSKLEALAGESPLPT